MHDVGTSLPVSMTLIISIAMLAGMSRGRKPPDYMLNYYQLSLTVLKYQVFACKVIRKGRAHATCPCTRVYSSYVTSLSAINALLHIRSIIDTNTPTPTSCIIAKIRCCR